MTKKQALKILEYQLEKIDTEWCNNAGESILFQTISYIKDFFGEDSAQYKFVTQFNFIVQIQPFENKLKATKRLEEKPKRFKTFLKDCIETLNEKGLYKPPKNNFISRMSEGWAIFWFSTILLVWSVFCYGFGTYQTQNKIDREKIEMKNKIDSLFRVTQSFIINTNKSANYNAKKSINSKTNKKN